MYQKTYRNYCIWLLAPKNKRTAFTKKSSPVATCEKTGPQLYRLPITTVRTLPKLAVTHFFEQISKQRCLVILGWEIEAFFVVRARAKHPI